MREIKFSAWDSEAKKMRDHLDPQVIQAVMFGNDYEGRIKLRQYTGLKDKNGRRSGRKRPMLLNSMTVRKRVEL